MVFIEFIPFKAMKEFYIILSWNFKSKFTLICFLVLIMNRFSSSIKFLHSLTALVAILCFIGVNFWKYMSLLPSRLFPNAWFAFWFLILSSEWGLTNDLNAVFLGLTIGVNDGWFLYKHKTLKFIITEHQFSFCNLQYADFPFVYPLEVEFHQKFLNFYSKFMKIL